MKRRLDNLKHILDTLTKEIGAYAIVGSWEYDNGVELQCTEGLLKEFARENNLEMKNKKIKIGNHILYHV